MADWELRPATAADIEPLVELRAVVMRADLERLGRYDEHRVRRRLRDAFEPAHTWTIHIDGTLSGCVALRPDAGAYWLEHFMLSPDVQGRGVGTAILDVLLDRCDREGATTRLDVLRGSPARRLYERHGFVPEGEDGVDVIMRRDPRTTQDLP
ncbi:GNAT family N-acetyltransferase [Streptomyces sp. NPDC090106]|uniref:GNAT family N-acetyltransferase n=1 Tax=Streptomyces sp. NPDC090106 TaxID=3365946 RepID=UPI0037FAB34A